MSRASQTSIRASMVCILMLAMTGVAVAQSRARGKFEPPPGKAMILSGCEWNDAYQKYKDVTGDVPAGGVFWYEFNGDTMFF